MAISNLIEIVVKVSTEGEGNVKDFKTDIKGLDDGMAQLGKNMAKVGAQIFAVVGGFTALKSAIVSSTREFAIFDDTMRNVGAIAGATAQEFQEMTDLAREMGETTRFTAQQAADALKFLSQAGLSASESMTALPQVLNLAAAGATDLARSADIVTNIMAGYGIEAKNLAEVNDVLVATFTNSNTNLTELGTAFQYVGPVAKQLGIEIEETSATLGLLASSGFKAEKGGAALRNIFLALIAPASNAGKLFQKLGVDTKELGVNLADQKSALKSLGVEINDIATGKLRPFNDILADLSEGLSKFQTEGEKAGFVASIFGKRAVGPLLSLLGKGKDAVGDFTNEIKSLGGITDKVAKQLEAGIGGSFRRLKSIIESVKIDLGAEFAPALQDVIEKSIQLLDVLKSTVVLEFGGLVSDVAEIAIHMGTIRGEAETLGATAKVITAGIHAIRDGVKTIAFGFEQIINSVLLLGSAMAGAVLEPLSELASFIDKDLADGLDSAAKSARDFQYAVEQDVIDRTEQFSYALEQGLREIEERLKGTKEEVKKTGSAFKDMQNKFDELNAALEAGILTQEEYNAAVAKVGQEAEEAYKAGNIDLAEKSELLQKVSGETETAASSTRDFADSLRGLGLAAATSSGQISEVGQKAVDAFTELANSSRSIEVDFAASAEEIADQLRKIEDQALISGDAIRFAFQEGIDTAQTIADVQAMVDAIEQAFIDQLVSIEAVEAGWESAEIKAGQLAAQAIATSSNIVELKDVFDAISDSSLALGEQLSEELLPALNKLSTEDLSALQDQMETLFEKALVDGEQFQIVSEAIANTISSKLGVATRDFSTGITTAVSESIEQFELLEQTAVATGDVLSQALTNIIDKAQTESDIEAIRAKLQELSDDGKLSVDELQLATWELNEALIKISESSAAGQVAIEGLAVAQNAFSAALSDTTLGVDEVEEASYMLTDALNAAFEAGIISAEELETQLNDVEDAVEDVADAAEGASDAVDDINASFHEEGIRPWKAEVVEGLEEIGGEMRKLFDYITTDLLDSVSDYGSKWVLNVHKLDEVMEQVIKNTRQGLQEFDALLQRMAETGRDTTQEAERLLNSFEILDDATLENLRSQIEAVKQTLIDSRLEAQDLVSSLDEEFLRLTGQLEQLEILRYQQRRAEIQALLDAAADPESQKLYQTALDRLEAIHQIKLENLAEQEQAQTDAIDRVYDHERTRISEAGGITTTDGAVGAAGLIESLVGAFAREENFDQRTYNITAPHAGVRDWFYEEFLPLWDDYDRRNQ